MLAKGLCTTTRCAWFQACRSVSCSVRLPDDPISRCVSLHRLSIQHLMATPLTQRPGHPFSQFLGNVLVQMRRNPVLAAVGIILLVLLFFLLLPGGRRSSRPVKGMVTVSPVTAKEYEAALVQRYEQQFH